jgi:hypothetical protein
MDEVNGKEKFDFMKFARIYPNSNGSARLSECPTEEDRIRYEKMYYDEDSVSTIEEFAELLDREDETA